MTKSERSYKRSAIPTSTKLVNAWGSTKVHCVKNPTFREKVYFLTLVPSDHICGKPVTVPITTFSH